MLKLNGRPSVDKIFDKKTKGEYNFSIRESKMKETVAQKIHRDHSGRDGNCVSKTF